MNIVYLGFSYVPSRRASSVHVMKMCNALAHNGHQVTLVTKSQSSEQERDAQDDFRFYGVTPSFAIKKLPRPNFRGGGLIHLGSIGRFLRSQRKTTDLVYSRNLRGASIAAAQGFPVIFEEHSVQSSSHGRFLHKRLIRSARLQRLVLITQSLAEDLGELKMLPSAEKVVIAPDGADPLPPGEPGTESDFWIVGVPGSQQLQVGYVGHLYQGRGIELIVALAERMENCCFHIVGGREEDLRYWRQAAKSDNLKFHGFVSPRELVNYYAQFDVLLMPYQRQVGTSHGLARETSRWMSPMKMFEYMAAGKPIISSDLPVLREVLEDGRNALLVPPDDIEAWVKALERLVKDQSLGQTLGQNARADLVTKYTWTARANRILDGLQIGS